VSRARLNVYLEDEHVRRLEEIAALKGISKSSIVATALSMHFSPERSAAVTRRLDALSRHLEQVERDQTILLETVALWIRHQLAVTASVPEALQDAARAQGRARFADFLNQLARHLQRGGSLVREVWQEIDPPPSRGESAAVPTRDGPLA
jgi:hypothetical protein